MKTALKNVRSCSLGSRAGGLYPLVLIAIWVLLAIAVQPAGDFPLNDDWTYARPVQTLLETGKLRFDDWGAPTLFFQVLYGALFCWPFGFSFTVLRISTLVAGLGGVLGLYALLRQVDVQRAVAFVASLTLMLNPLYFLHSFTFMTDVPFTALSIWAAFFFVRALKAGSETDTLVATTFSGAATLVRQVGIAVPLAYTLTRLLTTKPSAKALLRAVWPAAAAIALLVGYNLALRYFDIAPASQGVKQHEITMRLARDGLGRFLMRAAIVSTFVTVYVGLFTLPFSTVLLLQVWGHRLSLRVRGMMLFGGGAAFTGYVAYCFLRGRQMPFFGNTMNLYGLGPLTIRQAEQWQQMAESRLPMLGGVLTIAAGVGTVILILLLSLTVVEFIRRRFPRQDLLIRVALFAFLAAGVSLGPVSMIVVFDRYVLMLVPLAILLLGACVQWVSATLSSPRGLHYSLAGVFLAVSGFYSVAGTHDYLAWNRARWQAIHALVHDRSVPLESIDGGFEFAGWYRFPRDADLRADWNERNRIFTGTTPVENDESVPFYAVADAEYVVAFESAADSVTLDHSTILQRFPFPSWLLRREGAVVIVRRYGPP